MIETPFCKANEYVLQSIRTEKLLVSQAFLSFEKKAKDEENSRSRHIPHFLTNENYVLISSKMAEIT